MQYFSCQNFLNTLYLSYDFFHGMNKSLGGWTLITKSPCMDCNNLAVYPNRTQAIHSL